MGRRAEGCPSISTTMARLTMEGDSLRFLRTTAICQPNILPPISQGLKERLPYEPSFGWVGRTNSRLVNGHSPLFEKRPGPGPYHSRNHGGVRPGPYRPPPPPPDHEEHNRQNQHNQIEENNHNEHRQDEYFDHNNDHYGDHEDERYSQDTFADHERDTLPGPEEFHYPTGRRNEPPEHSDVDHDYVDVGFYGNQELEGGHAAYEFFEEDEEGEQRQGEGGYSPSAPSGPGFEERPPQDDAFGGGPSHHQGYESFQSDQLFDDGRRKGSDDLFLFSDPGSPPVDGFGNEVYYDTGDTSNNREGGGFFEGFSSNDQHSRGGNGGGSLFGAEDLFQPPKPENPDYDDIDGRQSAENFAQEEAGFGQEQGHPRQGSPRHGPPRQGGLPGLGPLLFGPRGPHRGPPGGGDRFNGGIFGGGKRGPSIRFGF